MSLSRQSWLMCVKQCHWWVTQCQFNHWSPGDPFRLCHVWRMYRPIVDEMKGRILSFNMHLFQNTANFHLWESPDAAGWAHCLVVLNANLSCCGTQTCDISISIGEQSENAACATHHHTCTDCCCKMALSLLPKHVRCVLFTWIIIWQVTGEHCSWCRFYTVLSTAVTQFTAAQRICKYESFQMQFGRHEQLDTTFFHSSNTLNSFRHHLKTQAAFNTPQRLTPAPLDSLVINGAP